MDKRKFIQCLIAGIATVGITAGCVYGIPKLLDSNKTEIVKPSTNPGDTTKPDAPLTHTVKFVISENETITQTVAHEGYATPEAIATVEGYTFIGWYIGETLIENVSTYPITQDTTFTAKFETITYTATIKVNGEEITQTVEHGQTLTLEDPTKEGYTFVGWSIDGETIIDLSTTPIVGDIYFIAIFEETATSASLFKFSDGAVTGYVGESTEILVPKTYSLGEVIEQSADYSSYYALMSGVKTYPYTIVDSANNTFEIDSYTTLTNERSNISFPVTATYDVQTYIDGTDFEVTSIADNAFKSNTTLTKVRLPKGITTIGNNAFNGCTALATLEIPQTITSLGTNVLTGCTNFVYNKQNESDLGNYLGNNENPYVALVSVDSTTFTNISIADTCKYILPNTFKSCTALTSIVIPESVEIYGASIFSGCTALTEVTLPNNIEKIYSSMFNGCTSLANISIPDSVKEIEGSAFYGCTALTSLTLPETVQVIGSSAFRECSYLETINLPEGITTIGTYTFYKCSKLRNITLPESLTTIETYAFQYAGLYALTIPDNVTTINGSAFSSCTSLKELHIGAGLTSVIGLEFSRVTTLTVSENNAVFDSRDNCNAVIETATNILVRGCCNTTLPNSVTAIGDWAFQDCNITSFTLTNNIVSIGLAAFSGTYIRSIVIPDSVTSIGDSAFRECSSLTSVTLSNNLTSIPDAAFRECKITEITIPDSVTSIAENAFYRCEKLTTITIGSGVTSIERPFWYCTALKTITIKATTPPTIQSSTLDLSSITTINIPAGTLEAYSSATYWTNHASKFVEASE